MKLVCDAANLYVGFIDAGSSGKATVMKYKGSAWNYVGTASFSNVIYTLAESIETSHFDLAVESGVPYVFYADNADTSGNVMKYDGTNWVSVGAQPMTSTTMYAVSLAVTGGVPCVVYKASAGAEKKWT